MSEARQFHLGDILTVTTGVLVAPRHMAAVYEILNFLTSDNLYTHQLPRVCKEVRPWILAQLPQLADVTGEEVTPENHKEWLAARVAEFGETLSLEPMLHGQHERIDPLSEAAEHFHPSKIIPVRS